MTKSTSSMATATEPKGDESMKALPRVEGGALNGTLGEPTRRRSSHTGSHRSGSDLSLLDAIAECGKLLSARDEWQWPVLMPLTDVVSLQRPCQEDDAAGRNRQRALGVALARACDLGELASSRAVAEITFRDPQIGKVLEVRDDVVHYVKAADFLEWLRTNNEEPTTYVTAWAKAIEDRKEEPASAFPLANFDALVAYRKKKKGASWTDGNQLEIARHHVGAVGVAAAAKQLGITHQALTTNLERDRKRDRNKQP